jgi:hypothetical protein
LPIAASRNIVREEVNLPNEEPGHGKDCHIALIGQLCDAWFRLVPRR